MFGIHLGRTREKIVAVADIESGSVALAIVAVPAQGLVRVLSAERRFLSLEEREPEATAVAIGTHLVEVGKKVLADYLKSGGSQPESVYAIVGAPWTRSKTVQRQMYFPQVTRITEAMISELAREALASDTELNKTRILEAGVIRTEVNGYPTAEPKRSSGNRLSVSTLISDCDPVFRAILTNAFRQLFGGQKVVMRSGVHAILSIFRSKPGTTHANCLVVDIASEGTNLTVVCDGATTEHGTISEGKNSILKRVGGNDMPENILTLLRLIARGECHDPVCQTVNSAMAKAEPELVRVFGEAIAKLVTQRRLPNNLILVTDDDLVPWLSSFFSRIDFAQFTVTTQPLSVMPLKPIDFTHLIFPNPGIRVDTGILIAAGLVNIEEARA